VCIESARGHDMSAGEPACAARLRAAVDAATPRLLALPAVAVRVRSAPGRWSPAEIIGHLIDSASNNHQRFVRAPDQNDLVFPGYAQDDWVSRQQYQTAPWEEIVMLWQLYNTQLARVMAAVPHDVRTRVHDRHNLHDIAWRSLPADGPATLDYFMNDYVDHLEHHLAQVFALTTA
jgi:hypothetical protein